MKSRAHIFFSGIVQGVYFRDYTRTHATSLRLTGWVRNCPDGRVEAIIEGERADLDTLMTHLWSGPPSSRVDDIQIQWEEYSGTFHDFIIRY
jgi:acylphosphatase